MKRKSRGLVIGKFMPPHKGHEHLVHFAQQRVDCLSIILFTKRAEAIPGVLRLEWMRQIFPEIPILNITDEHPIDFADPAIWELWIASIRKVYPAGPELVFSSEDYGHELARRLGARHVMVDRERACVPVSAARIRERPLDFLEFMQPCVQKHFTLPDRCRTKGRD